MKEDGVRPGLMAEEILQRTDHGSLPVDGRILPEVMPPAGRDFQENGDLNIPRTIQEEPMDIQRIGVVGCGLMGSGIAQCAAEAGCQVLVKEADEALLAKGLTRIHSAWDRAVAKGKATEEQRSALAEEPARHPSLPAPWRNATWWWRPFPSAST